MRDFLTNEKIDIKEKVLVVNDRLYRSKSYIAVDTRALEGYPPKVYYDKDKNFLAKMYDKGVFELDDIEDILLDYQDSCFSNHDLNDLRKVLVKARENFYKSLENTKKSYWQE